jgi:hypothetical protein
MDANKKYVFIREYPPDKSLLALVWNEVLGCGIKYATAGVEKGGYWAKNEEEAKKLVEATHLAGGEAVII